MSTTAARIAQLTHELLTGAQQLTKVGGEKAEAALQLIGHAISALMNAKAGTISLESLEVEIAKLRDSIALDDAALALEADAKYGPKS